MDPAELPRAVDAARVVAVGCGLRADDAVVVHDSTRIAVRLRPCGVLARVARASASAVASARFEIDIAQRLVAADAPIAALDPRVDPRVHEHDGFVVTLWTFHEVGPPNDLAPAEYADALARLHAAMRRAGLDDEVPRFTARVDEAQRLVDDPTNNPAIAGTDRELVGATLRTFRRSVLDRDAPEQVLHGEPHPGNVLRTASGLRFVDLETCCRGPVEFDIAHAAVTGSGPPVDVASHYPGADPDLLRDCWTLMLAMVTAWRCEPGDDLPGGRALAAEWIARLRSLPRS